MSSSLDHKCQRCGSQYHGQICPFCTITGLDVNALLAAEGLTMPQSQGSGPNVAEEPETASQVTLVDVVSNRTFPVNNPVCRFGRDISNDIVLTGDKSLSRFHFQITFLNGEYFVEDSGSRNGSFLNGSPVTAPRKVLNGDIISAGMTRYRFVIGGEDSSGFQSDFQPTSDSPPVIDEQATTTPKLNGMEDLVAQGAPAPEVMPPPIPPSAIAAAAANASAVPAQNMDPLARLFAEGQALMGANDNGNSDHGDSSTLSGLFGKDSNGGGQSSEHPSFMQLDHSKETPVEELFQEQLRTIAANEAKTTEEIAKPAASSREMLENTSVELDQNAVQSAQRMEATPPPVPTMQPEHLAAPEPAAVNMAPPPVPTAAPPAPTTEQLPQVPQAAPAAIESWPQWCVDYKLTELDDLSKRITELHEEISARQAELQKLSATVDSADSVKNRLLAGRSADLNSAIKGVFDLLGWETAQNGDNENELVVLADGRAVAILRTVCTEAQPKPTELASIVSSLSTYWCEHGVEPKGIMLVSFIIDGAPSERPAISPDYASYASKKNVCLMSSTQLLSIYRQVAFHNASTEIIKSAILDTSGLLAGYDTE